MINVFGLEIKSAFTNGTSVKAIYSNGVKVWPTMSDPLPNQIFYTTKNGNPLTFTDDAAHGTGGVTLTSHTYDSSNGVYVLTFSDTITQTWDGWRYQSNLQDVYLPMTVTTINPYNFQQSGLVSISMPGVSVISLQAFELCNHLTRVTIPESCTKIATGAFKDCSVLSEVKVERQWPPEMSQLSGGGYDQFSGTSQALVILVDEFYVGTYKGAAGWSSYSSNIVGYTSGDVIDFRTLGLTNQEVINSDARIEAGLDPGFSGDDFEVTFSGGSTPCKYFVSDGTARLYGGGSLTITSSNNTITDVKFYWYGSGTTYKPQIDCATPQGYEYRMNDAWSGLLMPGDTLTMTRPSGSGTWRLLKISVKYMS